MYMACTNLNFSYSTDQLKLLATLATSDLSNLNHQIRFHQWTSHMTMCIYRIRGIFVALVWRFGESSKYRQIKCTPFRL